MDNRWLPLVSTGLGVLGGIGGALVGGYVANQGQEEGFARERAAAIADLRRDEYSDLLGSAQEVVATAAFGLSEREQVAAQTKLAVAQARVALVRQDPEVERAADALTQVIVEGEFDEYLDAGARFIKEAREELDVGGG